MKYIIINGYAIDTTKLDIRKKTKRIPVTVDTLHRLRGIRRREALNKYRAWLERERYYDIAELSEEEDGGL